LDLELINDSVEELNEEVKKVLSYQVEQEDVNDFR